MKEQRSAGFVVYHVYKGEITYLLLHYTSGHWDFPKGKLEADETYEQAAHRELKEETGLSVTLIPGFEQSLDYIFKDLDGMLTHKEVRFFLGRSERQEATMSHEHQGFTWLLYDEAAEKLTYPNARSILSKAHEYILSTHIS